MGIKYFLLTFQYYNEVRLEKTNITAATVNRARFFWATCYCKAHVSKDQSVHVVDTIQSAQKIQGSGIFSDTETKWQKNTNQWFPYWCASPSTLGFR